MCTGDEYALEGGDVFVVHQWEMIRSLDDEIYLYLWYTGSERGGVDS